MSNSSQNGWYEIVDSDDLQQGDLINRFPIMIPPYSLSDDLEGNDSINKKIPVVSYNTIVVTQSCDLIDLHDNDPVVLCSRYSYEELTELDSKTYGANGWGNLIRGRMMGKHLLNKCDLKNHEFSYQVVDLRQIFNVPYKMVRQHANRTRQRIRLISPYREQLAQAFAYQFMRVGLLDDLPRKYPLK